MTLSTPTSYDWMQEARCRSLSKEQKDEYLFPEQPHNNRTRAFIAELCEPCPVKETCLRFAIENKIGIGCPTHIYGGMDFSERMRTVRKRVFSHNERKYSGR